MAIKTQRKSYTDKLDAVETIAQDVHMKIGNTIAAMRKVGLAPNRDLMNAYDSVLAVCNTIREVKSYTPSIVFADEKVVQG